MKFYYEIKTLFFVIIFQFQTDYGRFNADEDSTVLKSGEEYEEPVETSMALTSNEVTSSGAYGGYGGTSETHWNASKEQVQTDYSNPMAWTSEYQQPVLERPSQLQPVPPPVIPAPQQQRMGEYPPTAIARPRPVPSRRGQGQNDIDSNDQFGALSQYR